MYILTIKVKGNQGLLNFNELESQLRENLENKIAKNPVFVVSHLNDVLNAENYKCEIYNNTGDHQKAESLQLTLTETMMKLCDHILTKDTYLTDNINLKMFASLAYFLFDKLGNQVKEKGYGNKLYDLGQKLNPFTELEFPPLDSFKTAAEEKNELQHNQITYGNDNFEYEKNEEVKTDENKHPDKTLLGEMQ